MQMMVFIALFVAVLKLLAQTERPCLCAGILAGGGFVLALASGNSFLAALLGTALAFAYFSGLFWLSCSDDRAHSLQGNRPALPTEDSVGDMGKGVV